MPLLHWKMFFIFKVTGLLIFLQPTTLLQMEMKLVDLFGQQDQNIQNNNAKWTNSFAVKRSINTFAITTIKRTDNQSPILSLNGVNVSLTSSRERRVAPEISALLDGYPVSITIDRVGLSVQWKVAEQFTWWCQNDFPHFWPRDRTGQQQKPKKGGRRDRVNEEEWNRMWETRMEKMQRRQNLFAIKLNS